MIRHSSLVAVLGIGCAAALSCTARFPDGRISCVSGDDCPDDFFCHPDGLCYAFPDEPDGGANLPLTPAGLGVTSEPGVLVPGELADLQPEWSRSIADAPLEIDGSLDFLDGPDTTASYVFGRDQPSSVCTDCYGLFVDQAQRPSAHWDLQVVETLEGNVEHTWTLHMGDSFGDVDAAGTPFYRAIETIRHHDVITTANYGPDDPTSRDLFARFVARSMTGGSAPPAQGEAAGEVYICEPGGVSLFGDVDPGHPHCADIHFLFAQGVTSGCGSGCGAPPCFCPDGQTTREVAAQFVTEAITDPDTPLEACDAAPFDDVDPGNKFCPAIRHLAAGGFDIEALIKTSCESAPADECNSGNCFCPTDPITSGEAASFVAGGFQLALYEP